MPTIKIHDDVAAEITRRASPGETPNATLRRLMGLPPNQERKVIVIAGSRKKRTPMRRFSGILCTEGVESSDGRTIRPGALTWPDREIGLMPESLTGEFVGKVTRIWRDGNVVRCEGESLFAVPDDGLAMGCRIERYEIDGEAALFAAGDEAAFVITSAEIVSGAITQHPAFPDSRVVAVEEAGR